MKNDNLLLWILGIVATLFLLGGFGMFGYGSVGYGGMMGMMYGNNYGFPLFGWLFMTLITIALVFLIIWLFQQIQNPRRRK